MAKAEDSHHEDLSGCACPSWRAVKLHRRHFAAMSVQQPEGSLIKYLNRKKIFPATSESASPRVLFTKAPPIYNSAEIMESLGPWMLESPNREDCLESIL